MTGYCVFIYGFIAVYVTIYPNQLFRQLKVYDSYVGFVLILSFDIFFTFLGV